MFTVFKIFIQAMQIIQTLQHLFLMIFKHEKIINTYSYISNKTFEKLFEFKIFKYFIFLFEISILITSIFYKYFTENFYLTLFFVNSKLYYFFTHILTIVKSQCVTCYQIYQKYKLIVEIWANYLLVLLNV